MARCPQVGQVKTRLGEQVGEAKALELYESMLRLMCARLSSWVPGAVSLWVDSGPDHPIIVELANRFELPVHVQCAGDLGDKMARALEVELESADSAMVVGADCVGITRPDVLDAARAFARGFDLAVGPASDGGYYLLALAGRQPDLFAGIGWGTDQVFAQTLAKAATLNLQALELPVRPDVDTIEDLSELDCHTLDLLGLGSSLL